MNKYNLNQVKDKKKLNFNRKQIVFSAAHFMN